MTEQQKQLELEKRMNAIKIFESLEELKNELLSYTRLPEFKHRNYEVGMEIDEGIKSAEELERQLNFLIQTSEKWEVRE